MDRNLVKTDQTQLRSLFPCVTVLIPPQTALPPRRRAELARQNPLLATGGMLDACGTGGAVASPGDRTARLAMPIRSQPGRNGTAVGLRYSNLGSHDTQQVSQQGVSSGEY
jgi:hypothetical protein